MAFAIEITMFFFLFLSFYVCQCVRACGDNVRGKAAVCVCVCRGGGMKEI